MQRGALQHREGVSPGGSRAAVDQERLAASVKNTLAMTWTHQAKEEPGSFLRQGLQKLDSHPSGSAGTEVTAAVMGRGPGL